MTLSQALALLAGRERYLALERPWFRYDVGVQYGLLTAQLALALSGRDRDLVLTQLARAVGRSAPPDTSRPGGVVTGHLVSIITSADPQVRDQSVDAWARAAYA